MSENASENKSNTNEGNQGKPRYNGKSFNQNQQAQSRTNVKSGSEKGDTSAKGGNNNQNAKAPGASNKPADGQNVKNNHNRNGYQKNGHRNDNRRREQNKKNYGMKNVPRGEETAEDIVVDIERIEKEIDLEIKEIMSLRLGI